MEDKAIRDGLSTGQLEAYYLTDTDNQEDVIAEVTPKKRGRPRLYESAKDRKRASRIRLKAKSTE